MTGQLRLYYLLYFQTIFLQITYSYLNAIDNSAFTTLIRCHFYPQQLNERH